MKILITGAAGFIGSHLAQRLSQVGHEVIGLDNLCGYYDVQIKLADKRSAEAAGVRYVLQDLAKDDLCNDVMESEVVLHLAA